MGGDGTTSLRAELALKTQDMQHLEQRCAQLEETVAIVAKAGSDSRSGTRSSSSNSSSDDSADETKIIRTLRSNLALVQTELAQVQTEASQMAIMQQKSIATFKSTVFAEQGELNKIVLELRAENEALRAEKQEQKSHSSVAQTCPSPTSTSTTSTAAGKIHINNPVNAATLTELSELSASCHQTLKQVLKDSKLNIQRENKLADAYNTPDSEATMLSVKLSQLTDQFEILSFKYQQLQQGLVLESDQRFGTDTTLSTDQVNELVTRQAEVGRLSALVSELKEEHTLKVIEATRSNTQLHADYSALQLQYDDLKAAMSGHVSTQETLEIANKKLHAEVESHAQQDQVHREAVDKVTSLEAQVTALEQNLLLVGEASVNQATEDKMSLAAKLETVEGEKEALRKKISNFVALGDMREVGWQSERKELTKSIQQMTQDINFLRQNEKRLSQDALAANVAKRVSMEETLDNKEGGEGTVVPVVDSHDNTIDTTSRSRLAAQRAIKSGDLETLREELLHQVYRFEQLREHNAKLLQKVQQSSNAIQVCCRLRPPSEQELGQGADICLDVVDDSEITIYDKRMSIWKSFEFDKVWDEDAKQVDVFADVEPLALTAVDGYNACIFAYGMTGSGKTYTMSGYGAEYGVSYRVVHKIFELLSMKRTAIEKGAELRQSLAKNNRRSRHGRKMCASPIEGLPHGDSDSLSDAGTSVYSKNDEEATFTKGALYTKQSFQFAVTVSMLEIYNETVKDLLNTDPRTQPTGGMDIRHDNEGRITVPGLKSEEVFSLEDVMNVLNKGSANRATASTNINEHSSRSHSILMINVTTVVNGGVPVVGKLCMVDLAGSERVDRSGAQGRQLKEAQHINRSLSALGDVLEALEHKAKHVPYRNSKLTYLLQDSLGGNSRTMMIVTVCPTEITTDESLFCLQFASRARKIQMEHSKRNVSWKSIEESLKLVKTELKEEKKKVQLSNETIKGLKNDLKHSKDKTSSQMGFKLKNSDESRKSGEQQIQVLTRTNAELMLRLQEEKEQMKNVYFDMETNEKALRRVQEQLKYGKAERDRILATQAYKEQEIHNLREMVRLYEENEGEFAPSTQQQDRENHPHQHQHLHQQSNGHAHAQNSPMYRPLRVSTGGTLASKGQGQGQRNSPNQNQRLTRSISDTTTSREHKRYSTGMSHVLESGESMQRQPR